MAKMNVYLCVKVDTDISTYRHT